MYKRIRDLREDSDMTQKQIADILHCSQRVYSDYERGKLDIPTAILIKLADFHSVSVDYILERTDRKQPPVFYPKTAVSIIGNTLLII